MIPFHILATVDVLGEADLHIAVESYLHFFEQLSPKRQLKTKLMLLSTQTIPEKYHTNTQASWVASNIQELHSRQADEIKSCFQSSSLLFLPKMTSLPSPQDELLNGGLPILCHYKSGLKKQTDKSIALFASKNNSELPFNPHHAIEDYAEVLEMLYFDQCAQKLLLKRAQKKYKRKLNTGGIPTEALLLSFAATKGNISLSLHSI